MTSIRIARTRRFLWAARAFKVELDGKVVGRVRNGRSGQFQIPSGEHVLRIRAGFAKSEPVPFSLDPAATAQFRCDGGEMETWFLRTLRHQAPITVTKEPTDTPKDGSH